MRASEPAAALALARYAPGTLESYRRMLERVYPFIGNI